MSSVVTESTTTLRDEGGCRGFIDAITVAVAGAGWP
jgi:hypothetical protein